MSKKMKPTGVRSRTKRPRKFDMRAATKRRAKQARIPALNRGGSKRAAIGRPRDHLPKSISRDPERRALDAVVWMRKGKSRSHAARLAHTTPDTIAKYAAKAVRRAKEGRYVPRKSDRILRDMRFLGPQGVIPARVDSRDATQVAKFWNALNTYLRTGKTRQLYSFRGKTIKSGRKKLNFVTDISLLERLAHAGEVRFEDIYSQST